MMASPKTSSKYNENMIVVNDHIKSVAENHGIMMWLHPDGTVTVETPADGHYPWIHPNCYAPADLTQVYLMHGGGSGTAVFHGHSTSLGSIVMKHANARDSKEVFSLVTVRQELLRRGALQPEAAEYLRARIPEFVMVYISPYHVRNRSNELWTTLRGSVVNSDSVLFSSTSPLSIRQRVETKQNSRDRDDYVRRRRDSLSKVHDTRESRKILVLPSSRIDDFDFDVSFKSVDIYLPGLQPDGRLMNGVETLKLIGERLSQAQDANGWKVTLAQKQIGGENAENGAQVLTSGKLTPGALLTKLISEFTLIVRNLQLLTLPEEHGSVETVRREVENLRETKDVKQVSKELDSFVGTAIVKNYKPVTGRFAKLRSLGETLRTSLDNPAFWLTEDEELPAKFLGSILHPKACPSKFFTHPPSRRFALDIVEDQWFELLELAASFSSPSTTERIWTCGLTDAGLHNTFLSNDRGLELFDLGEPKLVPQPAFLTKFLMSFFHTLGMEDQEGESLSSGFWVNRFRIVGDRLALTDETCERMPYIYNAYTTASEHFVNELFEGDERVRSLLVKYVVLQLLSDASFCLERWEIKGGGTERYGDRVDLSISKWLWRSLWDIYIASHAYANLLDLSELIEDLSELPEVEDSRKQRKNPIENAMSWWDDVVVGSLHQVTSQLSLGQSHVND